MPACNATRLSGLKSVGGTWKPRPEPSFDPYCPFLPVRYNCMEKSTTADSFEYEPHISGCNISALEDSFAALAGKKLVMCGDSFMGQYFFELVCRFQHRIVRFNNLLPPFPPEGLYTNGSYGRAHYFNTTHMDNWEDLTRSRPPKYVDAPNPKLSGQTSGGQVTSYGIHGYSVAWFDHGLTVAFRSLRGIQTPLGEACLATVETMDWNLSSVDAVVASEFVGYGGVGWHPQQNILSLWKHLRARTKAPIPIYYVPSWTYGGFSQAGPRPRSLPTTAAPASNRSYDRAGNPVLPPDKMDAWGANKRRVVDLTKALAPLILSRKEDAHATIYPFTSWVNGTAYLCKRGMMKGDFNRHCAPYPWHICVKNPCQAMAKEGHFCQPGPVDSFLRIVLHAIVNDDGSNEAIDDDGSDEAMDQLGKSRGPRHSHARRPHVEEIIATATLAELLELRKKIDARAHDLNKSILS